MTTVQDAGGQTADSLRMTVYAALFAALIAVGAYLAIPVGPVPIVLQNFFAYLAALLLGRRWGVYAIGIYLLAGALGLPVFAGGQGGVARLVGPTGGYLVGYLPAVFIIGSISDRSGTGVVRDAVGMVCGTVALYACGIAWLKILTDLPWAKAVAVGGLPFLPGDAIKIAVALPMAKTLRPLIKRK
jgi:biotin transport system substrate-specific component